MRGIFSKLNISKALLTRGLSLVVVFATLVASYAALTMNKTLGWFAKNETVSANGMITQAYHAKFNVEYTFDPTDESSWKIFTGTVPFENLKAPGDKVQISFRVTSISSKPVTVTGFGLKAPGMEDETPKVDAQGVHYLSTELQTRLVSMAVKESNVPVTNEDEVFLRDEDSADSISYFDWIALEDRSFVLNPNEYAVFTVEFHFINRITNQNVFKNFHLSGKCERTIYIMFDE